MSSPLPYPTVEIRPERVRSVKQGHPWVFSGALTGSTQAKDGEPVVLTCGSEVLGTGLYHGQTDIAVRLLSRQAEVLDEDFFLRRFQALKARKEPWLPPGTNAYRLAFGEGDELPGLVIDKYGDVLVMQAHTAGMARLKEPIVASLQTLFAPRSLVERSELRSRKQEPGGKPGLSGVLAGELPGDVVFEEYGLKFIADVMEGQKTGFFLDQRENRQALRRWIKGRHLLNTFCYTGGFSVACAGDAASVTQVDISSRAMDLAKRHFNLNGLVCPDENFIVGDVFEFLKKMPDRAYDAILVDPPSFAKNRAQIKSAIKAYISLNTLALRKLPEGGILATSSCTAHIDALTFLKIVHQSAVEANTSVRVLDSREQPFDHPYHLSFPEGRYLKFLVLQKNGRAS